MTEGIINVNKPAGWTSQDVCSKLRHMLHVKKIGHTGTLDPMATGVLPVCIGKATRIIEYYDKDAKSYHASMKLGVVTDTLDITGEIIETGDYSKVSENAVREAFKAYMGDVTQVPPKYSAVKIDGRRAYDLAREGKSFDIKPRRITVYDNAVSCMDLQKGEIEFDITCSKGTYIRTVIDDIGRTLGCGAVMTALERTASGYFRIDESNTLEEIIEAAQNGESSLSKLLIPADLTLEKLGKAELNNNRVTAFLNGNPSYSRFFSIVEQTHFDNLYRVYSDGRFLGIASIDEQGISPVKVLG